MRIPRVYTDQPLTLNEPIALNEAAAHYLGKVLRLPAGRPVTVFNGAGGEFQGHLSRVHKKQVEVVLDSFDDSDRQSPLAVELAVGLSRGERWDFVLQKATELGAHRIVPLLSERTEVKLSGERLEKKQRHWRQTLISACEQCQRNRLPELAPLSPLAAYLDGCTSEQRWVLHHRDSQGLPTGGAPQSVSLLIGPEGGLSDAEIDAARRAGFEPLTLGPRVLRTETAPVAALSIVQHLWGDMSAYTEPSSDR